MKVSMMEGEILSFAVANGLLADCGKVKRSDKFKRGSRVAE